MDGLLGWCPCHMNKAICSIHTYHIQKTKKRKEKKYGNIDKGTTRHHTMTQNKF